MKLNVLYTMALAVASPVLSAAISHTTKRHDLVQDLFQRDTEAKEFPDEIKCPKTEATDEHEFDKDFLEKVGKAWAPTLNDKKKVGKSEISQGYPARFATGDKNAEENSQAWRFWKNTDNMKFSDECLDGYIWEIPLQANDHVWDKEGNNGDAGAYRLYFLAKDNKVIYCGSGVHKYKGSDPNKAWEFSRCEPDS